MKCNKNSYCRGKKKFEEFEIWELKIIFPKLVFLPFLLFQQIEWLHRSNAPPTDSTTTTAVHPSATSLPPSSSNGGMLSRAKRDVSSKDTHLFCDTIESFVGNIPKMSMSKAITTSSSSPFFDKLVAHDSIRETSGAASPLDCSLSSIGWERSSHWVMNCCCFLWEDENVVRVNCVYFWEW